ncbi:MAG: YkgJ family cysteine cluster protein [Myxococcota bacterium]|nr:YkgJ family cysteine cluster protein [Myxococcota bacterium]
MARPLGIAQRPAVDPIDAYRALRRRVDEHEAAAVGRGADLRCGAGCEACCHVSLAVSPLEAAELAAALRALDEAALAELVARLERSSTVEHVGEDEGSVDGDGNGDDEREDDELEDDELEDDELEDDELEDDDVRCVMLGDDGRCAVYAARPLVCRSQGLPLAYPNDVVPIEAVRARAGDKALVWCPLNFTTRPPTGPDLLDAGRLDEALALLNRAYVGDGDPLVRIDLRDLVAAAARERTVR